MSIQTVGVNAHSYAHTHTSTQRDIYKGLFSK